MFAVLKGLAVSVAALLALPAYAIELVMVEQVGCEWCERWNEEIAPIYPKTVEGKFAPLRRVDLFALPEDLVIDRPVNYTPTFLIVEDNAEIARLEGYPGEDFFWAVIASLLKKNTSFEGE